MMTIDPQVYTIRRVEVKSLKNFIDSAKSDLGEYAKVFTSSPAFSVNNNSEAIKFRLVKFDKDYLLPEIMSEIKKQGYELPEAQDAVWFAAQYPELQMEFPIAFLHQPWISSTNGGENVLILRSYSGLRYLHMHLFDSRWYSHIRFAVIEK
jgi:hypothetical protein